MKRTKRTPLEERTPRTTGRRPKDDFKSEAIIAAAEKIIAVAEQAKAMLESLRQSQATILRTNPPTAVDPYIKGLDGWLKSVYFGIDEANDAKRRFRFSGLKEQ